MKQSRHSTPSTSNRHLLAFIRLINEEMMKNEEMLLREHPQNKVKKKLLEIFSCNFFLTWFFTGALKQISSFSSFFHFINYTFPNRCPPMDHHWPEGFGVKSALPGIRDEAKRPHRGRARFQLTFHDSARPRLSSPPCSTSSNLSPSASALPPSNSAEA